MNELVELLREAFAIIGPWPTFAVLLVIVSIMIWRMHVSDRERTRSRERVHRHQQDHIDTLKRNSDMLYRDLLVMRGLTKEQIAVIILDDEKLDVQVKAMDRSLKQINSGKAQ